MSILELEWFYLREDFDQDNIFHYRPLLFTSEICGMVVLVCEANWLIFKLSTAFDPFLYRNNDEPLLADEICMLSLKQIA